MGTVIILSSNWFGNFHFFSKYFSEKSSIQQTFVAKVDYALGSMREDLVKDKKEQFAALALSYVVSDVFYGAGLKIGW